MGGQHDQLNRESPDRETSAGSPQLTFEEALDIILAHQRTVLLDRHRKYGPGNVKATGLLGLTVRASDKVERLKWLHMGGGRDTHADESELDSWMDLANFGMMAQMFKAGWWELPMEDEDLFNPLSELRRT